MNEKQRQAEWKARHLKALATLGFTGSYRTLKTLEGRMRGAALAYCNDYDYGEEKLEAMKEQTAVAVARLFGGELPKGFKINSDPRGHALKIDLEELTEAERDSLRGIHRDFGGYAILAPEEF
jgi:hypothetical protein